MVDLVYFGRFSRGPLSLFHFCFSQLESILSGGSTSPDFSDAPFERRSSVLGHRLLAAPPRGENRSSAFLWRQRSITLGWSKWGQPKCRSSHGRLLGRPSWCRPPATIRWLDSSLAGDLNHPVRRVTFLFLHAQLVAWCGGASRSATDTAMPRSVTLPKRRLGQPGNPRISFSARSRCLEVGT